MLYQSDRTWLFGASSLEERQCWMTAIESVIDQKSCPPNDAMNEIVRNDLRNSYARRSRGEPNSLQYNLNFNFLKFYNRF